MGKQLFNSPGSGTIDIDLNHDLAEIFRAELARLGYNVNDIVSDDEMVCVYFRVCRRLVSLNTRQIYKSQYFHAESKYRQTLADIERIIQDGDDIRPFLSKNIQRLNYDDPLLNDWGIHHLHLGTRTEPSGFINRSNLLLYCLFDDEHAYFIDILPHGSWTSQKLIKTVHKNWPQLLAPFRDRGVKGDRLTDEQIKNLRKKNINYYIEIEDGITYSPLGGGSMLSGSNILDRLKADYYMDQLRRTQQKIIKDFSEIKGRAKTRVILFSDPATFKLDIRGETFCAVETWSGYTLPVVGL